MKHLLFFLIVLTGTASYSQKRMTKTLPAEGIEVINFKLHQAYSVQLSTSTNSSISVKAIVTGENSEHIVITNRKYANSLYISSDFQPAYKDANDKRSVHKLLSIELIISVPKNKTVYLKSDIANVKARGDYKKLTLELPSGKCMVSNFIGNATVNTIDGDIELQTNYATINAKTTHGKTNLADIVPGDNTLLLNSVNGDITVTKSEE